MYALAPAPYRVQEHRHASVQRILRDSTCQAWRVAICDVKAVRELPEKRGDVMNRIVQKATGVAFVAHLSGCALEQQVLDEEATKQL